MIRIHAALLIVMTLSFTTCWDRQELDVNSAEMPSYELFGKISYVGEEQGVADLILDLTQLEVYQGDYQEPVSITTDSIGHYSFPGLYRGRYLLEITQNGLRLFNKHVGMINFDNREYDVEINRAIQLLDKRIDFGDDEQAVGLVSVGEEPMVLTRSGGKEQLRTIASNAGIFPEVGSDWRHNGLAEIDAGELGSIRRQIDTTWVDGNIQVSSIQYYLSTFNTTPVSVEAGESPVSGDQLTHDFSRTGFWVMRSNFVGQKSLYHLNQSGATIERIPLALGHHGVFSFIDVDTAFVCVDTSSASIWVSTSTDSLYGAFQYMLYDEYGFQVTTTINPPRFISEAGNRGLLVATDTGVWSAEILSY